MRTLVKSHLTLSIAKNNLKYCNMQKHQGIRIRIYPILGEVLRV